MKRNDKIIDIKKITDEFEKKKKSGLYRQFSQYVVDYQIDGEYIKVYSNIGKYRKVKKNQKNISKINQAIVKNKLAIANKIDEYEKNSKERLTVLLLNMCLLCGAGILVPLTFFIGSYLLFLLSIILFSFSVIAISIISLNYYILIKEIQNLKTITGYKKEMEFKLPRINLHSIK